MPVAVVERMARHDRCSCPRDKLSRTPNPYDARDAKGPAMKFGISQPLTRKEDDALLRGAGRYVADVAPAGALAAGVLRSPPPQAALRVTPAAAARAPP